MSTSMSHENEDFLDDIKDEFFDLVDPKFRTGQEEHGGNIWDMPTIKLIDAAIDEAIDQFVYLYTLKQQLLEREERIIEE